MSNLGLRNVRWLYITDLQFCTVEPKKRIYYRVGVLLFDFYQIQACLYCQVFLCYSMMMLLEKFWTKEILENQWITRAGKLTYSDPCPIVIVFIIINIIDHHLSYHPHQSDIFFILIDRSTFDR